MKFNCTIRMDNDAFTYNPALEVSRILKKLATDFEQGHDKGSEMHDGYLRDTNGNKVGYYIVEEDEY